MQASRGSERASSAGSTGPTHALCWRRGILSRRATPRCGSIEQRAVGQRWECRPTGSVAATLEPHNAHGCATPGDGTTGAGAGAMGRRGIRPSLAASPRQHTAANAPQRWCDFAVGGPAWPADAQGTVLSAWTTCVVAQAAPRALGSHAARNCMVAAGGLAPSRRPDLQSARDAGTRLRLCGPHEQLPALLGARHAAPRDRGHADAPRRLLVLRGAMSPHAIPDLALT